MLFDFNLASDAPGWAHPMVQIRDTVLNMTASDLTDALGELLQALMLLVNGNSIASCEWSQEPGGWRWNFTRPDETHVELVIAFKDDAYSDPWMSIEAAQVRMQERVPLSCEPQRSGRVTQVVEANVRHPYDLHGGPEVVPPEATHVEDAVVVQRSRSRRSCR